MLAEDRYRSSLTCHTESDREVLGLLEQTVSVERMVSNSVDTATKIDLESPFVATAALVSWQPGYRLAHPTTSHLGFLATLPEIESQVPTDGFAGSLRVVFAGKYHW